MNIFNISLNKLILNDCKNIVVPFQIHIRIKIKICSLEALHDIHTDSRTEKFLVHMNIDKRLKKI